MGGGVVNVIKKTEKGGLYRCPVLHLIPEKAFVRENLIILNECSFRISKKRIWIRICVEVSFTSRVGRLFDLWLLKPFGFAKK